MRNAILLIVVLLGTACSNYSANLPSIKPYKMDIQQGNVVTSKMMMQLRPGMTKSQVRFIMGTPLITDSFHADRWDYFYRMVKGGKLIEQRHVILEFENDQLKRVRGDVIPAETQSVAGEDKPAVAPVKAGAKQKEKGLLDKLKFWEDDEEAAAPAAKPATEVEAAPAAAPVQESKPAEPAAKTEEIQAVGKPQPAEAETAAVPAESKPEAEAQSAQVPQAEPVPAPEAAPAAEPAPAAQPAAVEPERAPKSTPRPAEELPPEEDPSYFERMLEQIGF